MSLRYNLHTQTHILRLRSYSRLCFASVLTAFSIGGAFVSGAHRNYQQWNSFVNSFLALPQELPGDYKLLNLGCPLVDPERADFAIEVFDDRATHDARSTVNLNRLIDDVLRCLGSK